MQRAHQLLTPAGGARTDVALERHVYVATERRGTNTLLSCAEEGVHSARGHRTRRNTTQHKQSAPYRSGTELPLEAWLVEVRLRHEDEALDGDEHLFHQQVLRVTLFRPS